MASLASHPSRILGIDPGLQTTGYAVLEATAAGPRIVEAGVIRSAEKRAATELAERVRVLYDGIAEVIEQCSPSVMVVEQLYAHYEHPRTAILMAHARGAFLLAGAQRKIDVISYAATRIKKVVTGSGRAGKEQMQAAIMREFGLAQPPEPHDVADALSIALCHYYLTAKSITSGSRSMTFTGVNREALLGSDPDECDDEPTKKGKGS